MFLHQTPTALMQSLWTKNQGDYLVHDVDRWSDPPPSTFWAKWFGGILFPALLLWPAFRVMVTKAGFIPGRSGIRMDIQGFDAILLGGALACLALFLHTHYFWGNSKRLFPFHELGKTLSLFGFCVTAVWLTIRLWKTAFGV